MSELAEKACRVVQPPEPAGLVEVAPNLFWSRIPLPGKLNHINVWLFRDDDGLTVVDSGMYNPAAEEAWRSILAEFEGLPLKRVIATHLHIDHIGMAGWLMEQGASEFWMTRQEYLTCRLHAAQAEDESELQAYRHFQRASGWPDQAIDGYGNNLRNRAASIYRFPKSYRRLEEGQELVLGGHRFRVVTGNGHSPEHACLYSEESRLLISGDQVLPGISSNISVMHAEPEANPMSDWLCSLQKLKREIPDDVLVLPAHQQCFEGLYDRIDELADNQERALARLRQALKGEPKRVVDLFEVLFGRDIGHDNLLIFSLATGETLACLNYLMNRAEVERLTGPDGVCRYHIPNV